MADSSTGSAESSWPVNQSISSVLFSGNDGEPLNFFIRPSETKARLKPLIEERGGFMSSRLSTSLNDWIKLAAEGEKINSDDYYTFEYIDDCISAERLLSLEKYRYKQQDPKPSSSTDTVMSNVTIKGRSKYSSTEDASIIAYIATHQQCRYSGNQVWKKMELLKVTSHSWQSMKHRFLNKLVDDLPRYIKSQEERAKADAALATESEGSSADNDDNTEETPPTCPSPEPSLPNEPVSDGYHGDSELSQPSQIQEPILTEDQEKSDDCSSDFDCYLIESAEKLTARRTRGSHGRVQQTSNVNVEEGQPVGTSKMHLRSHRGTSDEMGELSQSPRPSDSTKDTPERRANSHTQRRNHIPLDGDSKDLKEDALSDSDTSLSLSMNDSQSKMSWLAEKDQDCDQSVADVVKFVKSVMERYDVSIETVGQLLSIHSGDYDAVTEHLETGLNPAGHPLWTSEDDEKLNSTDPNDIKDLCDKYGQEAVMSRQEYFR